MRGAHNVSFSTTSIPLILAATSGVLSATSILFPSLFFLIWMAFVPFFLSLSGRSAGQRILLGLTTGLMYFGVAYDWVCLSTLTFFAFSPFVALVLFIGFLVWNGFVFVLFAVALRQPSSTSGQLLFAALPWVVLEHYSPTLVPWQLGAILQPHLAAFQLAELTGGAGLSFLIVLVNGWLFRAYEQYRVGAAWGDSLWRPLGWSSRLLFMVDGGLRNWKRRHGSAPCPSRSCKATLLPCQSGKSYKTSPDRWTMLDHGGELRLSTDESFTLPSSAMVLLLARDEDVIIKTLVGELSQQGRIKVGKEAFIPGPLGLALWEYTYGTTHCVERHRLDSWNPARVVQKTDMDEETGKKDATITLWNYVASAVKGPQASPKTGAFVQGCYFPLLAREGLT